jgi:hypothetical protein
MKKALTRHCSSDKPNTDGLASYRAAMKDRANADKQEVNRSATTAARKAT